MTGTPPSFHPLRWVLAVLMSLLWATMGSAAALADRGEFGQWNTRSLNGYKESVPSLSRMALS